MTMHFPFICFTSLAAARIASCLTVSNVFFCVTAQPPSFTITSTSHLSAITTDEKAKCEICQTCFFHPDSLVCLVPRVFFGHFSRDHPTRSRNMKHWRNNEVFITPCVHYSIPSNSQKKFVIPSDYSTKKDIISWTPNFRYLFHHPGNHATLLPAEENFVTFGIDRYIGIPLSPSHTNCPMSRIQD